MGAKLSMKAQRQLAFFDGVRVKTDRLYSLIEQYAAARSNQDDFLGPIARTAGEIGRLLMNEGYGVMADSANQIAMLGKRGGTPNTKARGFRELVSSIRAAMDTTIRIIIAEEAHKDAPAGGG